MNRLKVFSILVLLLFIGIDVYSNVYKGVLLIPSNADMVFSLRLNKSKLKQFKKSSVIRKRISEFEGRYYVRLEDIKVLYGANYKASKDMFFVGEGSFNSSSSYFSMLSSSVEKVVSREYSGIKYVTSTLDGQSFAILDNRLILSGLEKRLKLAIDLFLGKSKSSIKSNELYHSLLLNAPSNSLLRVVSNLPDFITRMSSGGQQSIGSIKYLKYIKTVLFDYTYGDGKDYLEFKGICSSKDRAELAKNGMKDFVEVQLPFLSLLLSNKSPVLLRVVQRGKFYTRNNVAISQWFLTPSEFNSVVGGIDIR